MMDLALLPLALRAVSAYAFLLLLVRISGKRTVRQGTPMDFIVALILGDMVDNFLWAEVSAGQFMTGTIAVLACHIAVTVVVYRSPAIAAWLQGREEPVIESSNMINRGMRRERLNRREIFSELRDHGVTDLRTVKAAGVELSGTVSVLKEDWAREAQQKDRSRLPGKGAVGSG